jgi:5-methylcytosine-specific restriction enzyme subunit McrC
LLLPALTVAGPRVTHPDVAMRLRRLEGILAEACTLDELDLRLARTTLTYNRLNEHYREAHQLAWLVLDGLGIDDLYAGGSHRTFAFLLDMNRLFEEFVSRWITLLVRSTPYNAIPKRCDRTILWNADFDRPYTSVIPDLVIERQDRPGRFLPVDAKYKLYDDRTVSTADIYQSFLYAYAYGQSANALPRGIILYPTAQDGTPSLRLQIRQSGKYTSAELSALGINLPATLAEVRAGCCGKFGTAVLDKIVAGLPPAN